MEFYKFKDEVIYRDDVSSIKDIKKFISYILNKSDLPKSKNALMFIKPNLNNDLNALTGNSTDLRVISSILSYLKKKRYKNVVVGDGPNCAIDHLGIDVLKRLCIDRLCDYYGYKYVNLNNTMSREVMIGKRKARVSNLCFDSDYFINVPKIKTHFEAGITIACKNFVGCLSKLNKRRVHDGSLVKNIAYLNEVIKPDLNIVDGLIVMEGDGPAAGTPKKFGVLIAGKNSFLVDAVCAKLAGFNYYEIPYLKIAAENGYLDDLNGINNIKTKVNLIKAKRNILARIFLSNIFVYPRFWKIFDPVFRIKPLMDFLLRLGIRQDNYVKQDADIRMVYVNKNNEDDLKLVNDYCPMSLRIDKNFKSNGKCIRCLYCYMVSKNNAMGVEGEFGFLNDHLERYGGYIKSL